MNDNRGVTFLLLLIAAGVFFLYNTKRLVPTVSSILGTTAGGGAGSVAATTGTITNSVPIPVVSATNGSSTTTSTPSSPSIQEWENLVFGNVFGIAPTTPNTFNTGAGATASSGSSVDTQLGTVNLFDPGLVF